MHTNRFRGSRLTAKFTPFLGAAVLALILASSASAVNVVPNPGFETDCGGSPPQPCNWTPVAGTPARDTAQKHSGAASYQLKPANNNQSTAHTACINASLPAGANAVGYWYRAIPGITGLAMTINVYGNAGCSGALFGVPPSFQPASINTGGVWTLFTASMTLPSPANSFIITLADGCSAACPGTQTAWFDDVAVGESPPTAVTLVSFRGTRTAHGVKLAWKTAAASNVAGFNVYRGERKVNRTLIASTRGLSGAYALVDRTLGRSAHAVTYRLQAVSLDGTRAWLGSTRVS